MAGIKPLDWLRAAIDDQRLTTTERAAVAAIARRAPGTSQRKRFAGQVTGWDFYLSRDELAGLMACSVKTAERCLPALHQYGLLEMVTRGGRRGSQTLASVWRLAIPNSSSVRTSDQPQLLTGEDMGTSPNSSDATSPTPQMDPSQLLTSEDPREHSYQESTEFQESPADASTLTRALVPEELTTTAQPKRPTQVSNSGTDRARAPQSWPAANTAEAWA